MVSDGQVRSPGRALSVKRSFRSERVESISRKLKRRVLLKSRQCSEFRQELGCCPWSRRACKSSCSRTRTSFSCAGLPSFHCSMHCCADGAGKESFWILKAVLSVLLLSSRDSS